MYHLFVNHYVIRYKIMLEGIYHHTHIHRTKSLRLNLIAKLSANPKLAKILAKIVPWKSHHPMEKVNSLDAR